MRAEIIRKKMQKTVLKQGVQIKVKGELFFIYYNTVVYTNIYGKWNYCENLQN